MNEHCYAIVPAAGVGKRVGGNVPKQYRLLNGKPIIEWTLERLLEVERIQKIIIVISDGDEYWADCAISKHPNIVRAPGGSERCYSVLNGLNHIQSIASENDWVLVHDAARPCVRKTDINKLIDEVTAQDNGGLLAVPVRDTMKQSGNNPSGTTAYAEKTVDRSQLWHALTPQMFRYQELHHSLSQSLDDGYEVTDEASAMEHCGFKPLLITAHSDNIKVTMPEDIQLAEYFLQQQTGGES